MMSLLTSSETPSDSPPFPRRVGLFAHNCLQCAKSGCAPSRIGSSPLSAAEAGLWDRGVPQLIVRLHGDRPLMSEVRARTAELEAVVRAKVLTDLEQSEAFARLA